MIERDISTQHILEVINHGEIITAYSDDKPYPIFLLLKFVNSKPIHVLLAQNSDDDTCIIIPVIILIHICGMQILKIKSGKMECSICKTGNTHPGKTTSTFEKDGSLLVFRDIEADICDNCGEAYFSLETTNKIQQLSNDAVKKGAEIEIVRMAS